MEIQSLCVMLFFLSWVFLFAYYKEETSITCYIGFQFRNTEDSTHVITCELDNAQHLKINQNVIVFVKAFPTIFSADNRIYTLVVKQVKQYKTGTVTAAATNINVLLPIN